MKNMCVSCDDGFSMQSTDKSELREGLKMHLEKHHSEMKISGKEIESKITSC